MPVFPKIDSPCPYKDQLSAVMDGDFCRMCKRQVFDLSAFDDSQRLAFLSGCKTDVCVSYRLPARALAAAAFAAAAAAFPTAAAAQDEEAEYIMVGGIKNPAAIASAEDAADAALPELPVVYEEEAPVETSEAPPAAPARGGG